MTEPTAEAAKNKYIEKMGEALGSQFDALFREVAWLHFRWGEYVELVGNPKRVEVLDEAASALFRIILEALWEQTLLHIARLTDRPKSSGKENLTIRNLPELVRDPEMKQTLVELVETAESKAQFCRDWRNRHIAHRDLDLAMNKSAKELEIASISLVNEALASIAKVLNEVSLHYMDSALGFTLGVGGAGNALRLLRLLHHGMRAQMGKLPVASSKEDYPPEL